LPRSGLPPPGERPQYERGEGSVYCWGYNAYGQIGDGTTALRKFATPVYASNAAPFGSDLLCNVTADCADDGKPCTIAKCIGGTCKHVAAPNGVGCADGAPCTTAGTCKGGKCQSKLIVCNDANKCTADACAPATGRCVHAPIGGCK